jgi:hemoglobin-like flavoprotein
MDPGQIALVQVSFNQAAPQAAETARRFYSRLFELRPELRALFKGDMEKQGLKLMTTLQLAIGALSDVERIRPALVHLGRSHVAYGVRDEHYAAVGEALLWALEQVLGEGFTPEVRSAWAEAYAALSSVMRAAAVQAETERAAA